MKKLFKLMTIVLATCVSLFILTQGAGAATSDYEVKFQQTEINYRHVTVSIPKFSTLITKKYADKVKVTAEVIYKGKAIRSTSKTVELSTLKGRNGNFSMAFSNYGKFTVIAKYYKGSKLVYSAPKKTVGVVAEEYNIMPLNASFPVLQATLQLWDITKNPAGDPIPTIIALSRPEAYDWDRLPANVYFVPYLTNKEVRTRGSFTSKVENQTTAFVKDLYLLNKNSKFNLYVTDNHARHVLAVLTRNRIPENLTKVTLLSDGVGSYGYFNTAYNVVDPSAKHVEMEKIWQDLKDEVYKTKTMPDFSKLKYRVTRTTSEALANYSYVIATDLDVPNEWLLARRSNLSVETTAFSDAAKANPRVIDKGLNPQLNNLKAKGMSVQKEFKRLYNFNDDFFSKAVKENKKIMVILGSYTHFEYNLNEYVRYVMARYGDGYVYYFKGHPAYPTGLDAEKAKRLEEVGLIDVDSTIPAELLLFFYPSLYLSGYSSSTFLAVEKPEMACGLFQHNKASGTGTSGGALMDYFISPIYDSVSVNPKDGSTKTTFNAPDKVKALATGSPEYKGQYLVEFANNTEYDIAIWNSLDSTITYYKDNAGVYELVKKEDSVKTRSITTSKSTYTTKVGSKAFPIGAKTTGIVSFTYKSSNTKIATVSGSGKITPKAKGKATITITAKATGFYKVATKTVSIIVNPKK